MKKFIVIGFLSVMEVGLLFANSILPETARRYDSINYITLPPTTMFLINIGRFLEEFGYIVIPISVILVIILSFIIFIKAKK